MTPTLAFLIAVAALVLLPALGTVMLNRFARRSEFPPARVQLGKVQPTYRTVARYVFRLHGTEGEFIDVPVSDDETARVDAFLDRNQRSRGEG